MRKRGAHFKGKHTPAARSTSAWAHCIGMQQLLTDDQRVDLGVAVHTSIERIRLGEGIELDWHTLAAAVNVSLVLCERGVGGEYLDDVKRAQDALIEIHQRHQRTGRWAFSGGAYIALARAVELHEAQLAAITRDGARAAMLEVRRRVERGEVLNQVPA
jgi:hypothetical protein